jgi:hypothetical protein
VIKPLDLSILNDVTKFPRGIKGWLLTCRQIEHFDGGVASKQYILAEEDNLDNLLAVNFEFIYLVPGGGFEDKYPAINISNCN